MNYSGRKIEKVLVSLEEVTVILATPSSLVV